jgi:hypothetical protein
MRLKLMGKEWGLIFCPLKEIPTKKTEEVVGLCDFDNSTIFCSNEATGLDKLDTLIHELTHALKSKWTDKEVVVFSKDVAAALWKIGYRKVET